MTGRESMAGMFVLFALVAVSSCSKADDSGRRETTSTQVSDRSSATKSNRDHEDQLREKIKAELEESLARKEQERRRNNTHSETLTVSSRDGWQTADTPVRVQNRVQVRARGRWTTSPKVELFGPNGFGSTSRPELLPHSDAEPGSLIVRVRGSDFVRSVGSSATFLAEHAGPLEFRINENDRWLDDNVGSLTVTLTVSDSAID